jgi:GNAT superfamily N-acetyltransferase
LTNPYRVRAATFADADTLVAHRIGMFTDMGVELDAAQVGAAFRQWLAESLPSGLYHAWLIETVGQADSTIVGGGGVTVLPWPPGPRYLGDRLAFVYNVYTEPAHRHRGVARLLMDHIHGWCRAAGITSVALNASADGRRLYEAMGYTESPSPMMFVAL